jgi:pimeloyl-ACP methyl ester carboxylesterase
MNQHDPDTRTEEPLVSSTHHTAARTDRKLIDGVGVDIVQAGGGDKTLLYLHSVDGVDPAAEWFQALAQRYRVVAPWHPGFGGSDWPPEFRTVGDLAFFYLELIRALDIQDAILMGSSFGGWLAAEIAVRSHDAFAHLVLLDPLGIKVGGREDRDIADMHALSQDELARLAYHDPARRRRDYAAMSDEQRLAIARSREAYTYFGWRPYMHDPSLRRWLRRIRVATLLVWGASDGIVSVDYGRAYAAQIPGARFEVVEDAGHYPHVEQPQRVAELVERFAPSQIAVEA